MRPVASAVLIAALALSSLSGCFLLPQAPRDEPSGRDTAEVDDEKAPHGDFAQTGDCWQTSYGDMAEWQSWEGDGPVDCDEDHQAYTVFAGDLEAEVDDAWEDGTMSSELFAAVIDQCDSAVIDFGIPEEAARAGTFFFVAPEKDWEDGDHRIRCDIAVSELDSAWLDADLEELPSDIGDLIDDIDKNPTSYELCIVGDGFGPYESDEAYLSDCGDDEYYWRFAGNAEYDEPLNAPYPDDTTLYGFADEACAAFGARGSEIPFPYVPSGDTWKEGDRSVYCWFSTVQEPSTPV